MRSSIITFDFRRIQTRHQTSLEPSQRLPHLPAILNDIHQPLLISITSALNNRHLSLDAIHIPNTPTSFVTPNQATLHNTQLLPALIPFLRHNSPISHISMTRLSRRGTRKACIAIAGSKRSCPYPIPHTAIFPHSWLRCRLSSQPPDGCPVCLPVFSPFPINNTKIGHPAKAPTEQGRQQITLSLSL